MAGSWTAGRDRRDGDHSREVSSFDVLGEVPIFQNSTALEAEPSSQQRNTYGVDGDGLASGTGCSTESGLEHAFERASVTFDSDEELEAIRGSVRSLRAQRAAVEKLKEKARREEGTADLLRRKLGEAESRIRELRAQGGRDVVRRLMDEVTELRARLKATSTAFQTRENSVAELREAVQHLRMESQAGQEKLRAQSRKLQEQGRESQEQLATINRLEDACARCEERAEVAEKMAEEKCAASGRELASLSALLREANATVDASKGNRQATLAKHKATLEAARKTAKLRQELSSAQQSRREEDAGATIKLRSAARQAEELKAELAAAKSEAVDRAHQLVKCREEMSKFHEDVGKLRDAAAQLGDTQRAVRDRDQTITGLTRRLELEKRERGQWGQARKQLLLEFCEEENKLRSTLQPTQQDEGEPSQTRRRRNQRQQQPQQQQQQQQLRCPLDLSPSGSDRSQARDDRSLSQQSPSCSVHTSSENLVGGGRVDDSLRDYGSYLERGKEEKTDHADEGGAPHEGQRWREGARTEVEPGRGRAFDFGKMSHPRHENNRTAGREKIGTRPGRRVSQQV